MKRTVTVLAVSCMLVGAAIILAHAGRRAQSVPQEARPVVEVAAPAESPAERTQADPQKESRIDIVLALDTSGSMSGLIDAARQKLWDIVNQAAQADPKPRLRIGLVTYGSRGSERDGYVIIQSDLTNDLDAVYAKLFELTTSGGTEYVARAVFRSVNELSWDSEPDALRQIYVAGNEGANQDRTVSVEAATELAKAHDIFVNAIYCGPQHSSDAPSWRAVAHEGNGLYAAIDHNHGTVALATPYDDRLAALSSRLNRTYVAYGRGGGARSARQAKQDENAARLHKSAAASRALAKASKIYTNTDWDLVDAVKAKRKIARRKLPKELAERSDEEIRAFVKDKAAERRAIQAEIKKLGKKRKAYLVQEMKRQGKDTSKAFDTAVKGAMQAQAAAKNIMLK
jgi:hypothetical protein